MKIILKALVGSHLYGLNTEESDEDFLGIFVRPTTEILGIFDKEDTYVTKGPDTALHEVKKFMRLAAKGNPTVLELLYCPEYLTKTFEGTLLVQGRKAFLSNRVMDSFGGYAYQQFKKLQKRVNDGLEGFNPAVKKRTPKHAMHCFRLLRQGKELMETGTINPRVDSPEEYFDIGKLPVDEIINRFQAEYSKYLDTKSILPDSPDWTTLNQILLDIREAN